MRSWLRSLGLVGLATVVSVAWIGCSKSKASEATGVVTAAVEVGKLAPDFTLRDLDGNEITLSSFKGKTIVLEWFNPDCPFVRRSHTEGPLADLAAKATADGVVWLAINSGAPGKQGTGLERNKEATAEYKMAHPVLLDESGEVGKLYGARTTPQMVAIDETFMVRYNGAIDNAPRGTPSEGGYRNHLAEALVDLAAKRAVRVSETKPYGCSVKYQD